MARQKPHSIDRGAPAANIRCSSFTATGDSACGCLESACGRRPGRQKRKERKTTHRWFVRDTEEQSTKTETGCSVVLHWMHVVACVQSSPTTAVTKGHPVRFRHARSLLVAKLCSSLKHHILSCLVILLVTHFICA